MAEPTASDAAPASFVAPLTAELAAEASSAAAMTAPTMRGITKENLIGMHARPTAPQSSRDIAADAIRKELHRDEPRRRKHSECGHRRIVLDHGETETRPMPAPSATNAKENAAATNAPAKTAAHDTPDTVSTAVTVAKGPRAVTVACVMCSTSR